MKRSLSRVFCAFMDFRKMTVQKKPCYVRYENAMPFVAQSSTEGDLTRYGEFPVSMPEARVKKHHAVI